MSREQAVPLVQVINRHDARYQAEAHFLLGMGSATAGTAEAIVLLTDRTSRQAVASFSDANAYPRRFC